MWPWPLTLRPENQKGYWEGHLEVMYTVSWKYINNILSYRPETMCDDPDEIQKDCVTLTFGLVT